MSVDVLLRRVVPALGLGTAPTGMCSPPRARLPVGRLPVGRLPVRASPCLRPRACVPVLASPCASPLAARLTTEHSQVCQVPELGPLAPFTTTVQVTADAQAVVSSSSVVLVATKQLKLIPQFGFKLRLTFAGGSRKVEVRWVTIKGMTTFHISAGGDCHDAGAALPLGVGSHVVTFERGAMWRIKR
jgi:hypothetical protein